MLGRDRSKGGDSETIQILAPTLGEQCLGWRQGDVFRGAKAYVFDWAWEPRPVETPHGAVVVSQSCDASQPGREYVQVAPLVHLDDPNTAKEAAAGKRPQYLPVPRAGSDLFADLDGITTVAKTALLQYERAPGVVTDREIREFAFSVSRRFGRFAYPDDVVKCMEPLKKALRAKAQKEQSPMGKALKQVHSFRVFCEDWAASSYELTIIVIMEPDAVPTSFEELDAPSGLDAPQDGNFGAQAAKYAEYLTGAERKPAETYFGWQYLAETWARQCEETAKSDGLAVIGSVTAELAAVDDFPLSRFLTSESLDLDYLSDSRKPIA